MAREQSFLQSCRRHSSQFLTPSRAFDFRVAEQASWRHWNVRRAHTPFYLATWISTASRCSLFRLRKPSRTWIVPYAAGLSIVLESSRRRARSYHSVLSKIPAAPRSASSSFFSLAFFRYWQRNQPCMTGSLNPESHLSASLEPKNTLSVAGVRASGRVLTCARAYATLGPRQLAVLPHIFGMWALPYVFLTRAAGVKSDCAASRCTAFILERIGGRGLCPSFLRARPRVVGQSPENWRQYPRRFVSMICAVDAQPHRLP